MLSKRLKAIADMVMENSIVADIGTDHGYIPVYLVRNKISKMAIGTDISQGSLNKIVEYVNMCKLSDKIDTRLGDGLEVIKPFEADTLIIAGMGGILIKDILDRDRNLTNTFSEFILQPMTAIKELRKYLYDNGFEIINNEIIREDRHFYQIIKARIGKDSYDKEIDLEIPGDLYDNPLTLEYINREIKIRNSIIENISDVKTDKTIKKLETVKAEIKEYREVVKRIEGQ